MRASWFKLGLNNLRQNVRIQPVILKQPTVGPVQARNITESLMNFCDAVANLDDLRQPISSSTSL